MNNLLICDLCEKHFNSKIGLINHNRIHKNNKQISKEELNFQYNILKKSFLQISKEFGIGYTTIRTFSNIFKILPENRNYSGVFTKGSIPHNKGKTKENYKPLQIVSNKLIGSIGWNTGLTKKTDIRIRRLGEKISEKMKGRKHSYMIGDKNVSKIPEIARKISTIMKEKYKDGFNPVKGKHFIFSDEHKKKIGDAKRGKSFEEVMGVDKARELKIKMAKRREGSKSHFWKGGKSFEPYSSKFNKLLKKTIRERDNYLCPICKEHATFVHHIDYNKQNCNPDNLITMCPKHHAKTNFNRNEWMRYFKIGGNIPCEV